MKKRNILYLSNFGDIVGGGEVSLLGLLSLLDASRFVPAVVCPAEGELAEEIRKLGIEVSIIPMPRLKWINPVSFFRTLSVLLKLIRGREISLVHANGSRCAVYGGIACRLTKIPMIWHVRILESDGLLDRLLAGLASVIIVNSNAVKDRFKWLKDRNKLETVYNGIDLNKFRVHPGSAGIRRELGVAAGAPLVGTVGRLDWYKAHQHFIQAAKLVKEAMPGARFLIAGEGAERAKLEAQVKELGLEEDVIFAGQRRDIPDILAGLDVFALSSVSEGFGRGIVEAMACGKPVVATMVGGIPEVVEDGLTGKLVPAGDPAALAGAITGFLKDKELAAAMGAAGRKRAERFSIGRNVEKTQDIYESALSGRCGSGEQ